LSRNETDFPFRDTSTALNIEVLSPKAGNKRTPIASAKIASAKIASDIYCGVETIAIFAMGHLVAFFYVNQVLGVVRYLDFYIWPLLLLPLTYAALSKRSGMYEITALCQFSLFSAKAIASLIGAFFTVALVGVILGVTDDFSRFWLGAWLLSSVAVLWFLRVGAALVFSRWYRSGILRKRVAILGAGKPLTDLLQKTAHAKNDVNVVGILQMFSITESDIDHYCSKLIEHARLNELDAVIIALPSKYNDILPRIVMQLVVLPAEINLYPYFFNNFIILRGVSALGTAQFVDLQQRPIDGWSHFGKVIEDYTLALFALIALSPVMLLVALAIKLDSPGPVFFRQSRNGLNNKVFQMFKFRTMKVTRQTPVFLQAKANDERLTHVGRWLRRFSIDELPQLFNVLRGEMSMVGPRPHPIELNREFADKFPLYSSRHRMKPGITGWAQVNDYRGPTVNPEQMLRRMECDLYYIDNWSIWFDLSIIATTPLISIINKNAV
jgi:putative colanic acid biosynthesis UDP-glucose lipid carrier transferase